MSALGKDWTLWIDGKLFPCQQVSSTKADNEVLQVMHKGNRSSKFREYESALSGITITAEGVLRDTSYVDLYQRSLNGYDVAWEIKYQGTGMMSGRALIQDFGDSAPIDGLTAYSVNFVSTGTVYFNATPSGQIPTLDEVLKSGNTSLVAILAPIYASELGLPIIDQASTTVPSPVIAGKPAFGMGSDGKIYSWPIGGTKWEKAGGGDPIIVATINFQSPLFKQRITTTEQRTITRIVKDADIATVHYRILPDTTYTPIAFDAQGVFSSAINLPANSTIEFLITFAGAATLGSIGISMIL